MGRNKKNTEAEEFAKFMAELMEYKKVPADVLGMGLYSRSNISRIKSGIRYTDKLMRDRIITRLGMTADRYDNYLRSKEYDKWQKRWYIIKAVEDKNIELADELLDNYKNEQDMTDLLVKQFYLAMLIQNMNYKNATKSERLPAIKEAVSLTMSHISDDMKLSGYLLSVQELNLLLEYIECSERTDSTECYKKVIKYIEESDWEKINMAKLYPKVIYYLCNELKKKAEETEMKKSELRYLCMEITEKAGKAMDILRETGRMYYLWELLEMIKWTGTQLDEKNEENEAFMEALIFTCKEIYKNDGKYSPAMTDDEAIEKLCTDNFCYLYHEKNVHCIEDVIRIRRNMLGMSVEELYYDICSKRTADRIEKKEVCTQRATIKAILSKLNMSDELYYAGILTGNTEAVQLDTKLTELFNERKWEEAEAVLKRIEELTDVTIPVNNQYYSKYMAVIDYRLNRISQQEYIERIKDVLGITINHDDIIKNGEDIAGLYLTDEEILCIHELAYLHEREGKDNSIYIDILCKIMDKYEKNEQELLFISMYEIVIKYIASLEGNLGNYDISDMMMRRLSKKCIQSKRLRMLHRALYNVYWNNNERIKKDMPVDININKTYLENALIMAVLADSKYYEKWYKKKLEALEN